MFIDAREGRRMHIPRSLTYIFGSKSTPIEWKNFNNFHSIRRICVYK